MSVARDPFETLTDAFLGSPRAKPSRTMLLVGHLPVMSGLWLSQYADREARDRGPVCMLRIEHDAVQVELLRAGSARPVIRPQATLDDALRAIAGVAAAWLIVPRSSDRVEIPAGTDDIVILTGADDAAVVAAYRLVKQCVEEQGAEQQGAAEPPALSVAVLGADDEESARVAEKLGKTTGAFLKVDLPVRGGLQRVSPVESSFRGTFDAPAPTVPELLSRLDAAERASGANASTAVAPEPVRAERFAPRSERVAPRMRAEAPIPISTARPKPTPRTGVDIGEVVQAMVAARASVAQAASTARPSVAAPAATPTQTAAPAPSAPPTASIPPSPMSAGTARAVAGELPARLVPHLAALAPVPFTMPRNAAVELATDGANRLHVVARLADLASALRARAWAREHAAILALAHPGLSAEEPALDLVVASTADAVAVDGATVHALTLVELEGRRGYLAQTLAC